MAAVEYFSQNSLMIWIYLILIFGVFWAWGLAVYKILKEFLP